MKKTITKLNLAIILLSVNLLINKSTFAQAPQKMSYQAVIRNNSNALMTSTPVGMKISVLQGTSTGTAVYVETQTPSTNANGLVNLEIGTGTVVSGTFAGINWGSGPYFIKTETDPTGGTAYTTVGTNQLMSVPYALFSANGTPGATGPTGPQGAIGLTGANGTPGATGTPGTNGTNGSTGAAGSQGIIGATGLPGTNGTNGSLSSGTTAGNTPYWNGTVWVVNNSNIHNNGSGVGIGTTSPNASAKVEIASTTQGFLPPRMTTVQRTAIASPAIGLVIYNTTTNCLNFYMGSGWNETCGTLITTGIITGLNCVGATTTGSLESGTAASGVSKSVPYTGGNAGNYGAQAVSSTGVLGLTANLAGGTFASGAGNLVYTISGTPATSGTASFAIAIGGQSCSFTASVAVPIGTFAVGTVNCSAGPTLVVNVTNPTTGKIWMDRNLGAAQVATSSSNTTSYGDLYQWGRLADGHQCRNSATTATLSSTDQPANGSFIESPYTLFDWLSPQNDNLWQGVNGVNNPCPSGYRIPTDPELEAERLSWTANTSAGAFNSPLKLSMVGRRTYNNNGSFDGVGTDGFYWGSSVSGTNSGYLRMNGGDAYMNTWFRANAFAVRCIKN